MKMRSVLMACFCLLLCFQAHGDQEAKSDQEKIGKDLQLVQACRQGLGFILTFTSNRPGIFSADKNNKSRLFTRQEKEEAWNSWKMVSDYFLALDSLRASHNYFERSKDDSGDASFLIAYAAFLAQYRFALEWIERTENNPDLDTIFNEPVPEMGLPENTYSLFKFRFLNVARATEFAALETVYSLNKGRGHEETRKLIREDADAVWKAGKFSGQILTAKNALKIVKKAGFAAWMPVQTGVSEYMGDTKVYRRSLSLITEMQIRSLQNLLEPGDILLERREWYLSNIGLPGFWPHAALYVGTPEERKKYFEDSDEKDIDARLKSKYLAAYLRGQELFEGHVPRVLEAISEGVTFTSLEHSASCDSLAVLRPRLSKKEKALAILRAFHYAGRPYDFNFDFQTDATLVCSELIYKAYEPSNIGKGLKLGTEELLGRLVTPPNSMVKQFDQEAESGDRQMDLVLFLDGHEWKKSAELSDEREFRESWKRPKWHIFVQGKK